MDHSWRPRPPPTQGNLCPTCLISHFPFCPPHHPSFHQNPRFAPPPPPHADPQFQRPHFDPFLDHRDLNSSPHRPFLDVFADPPRPWLVNPSSSERGQFHGQPHRYDHGVVGVKRMRVDEIGVGSENYANSSRINGENERRLKLIRDHGGLNSETKEHDRESLGFGNIDVALPSRNFVPNDFDRKGNLSHRDSDFMQPNYREDHGLASAPQYTLSNGNGKLGLVQEGVEYKSNVGDMYSLNFSKGDLNEPPHMSRFQSDPRRTLERTSDDYYKHDFHRDHDHPLEHRSNFPAESQNRYSQLPQLYSVQHSMQPKYDFQSSGQLTEMRHSLESNVPSQDRNLGRIGHTNFPTISKYGSDTVLGDVGPMEASRDFNVGPPLPASPPPPLPRHPLSGPHASPSPPRPPASLFPIHLSSSATAPSSYPPFSDHSFVQPSIHNKPHLRPSAGFASEDSQAIMRMSSNKYLGEGRSFPPRHLSSDKPKVVDASHIFNQPHRAQRPDHIVIILRGLPGSGKSYLAKMLRDIEVENGGDAPRIHSMDDYFMSEVEKVEKSATSGRGKKPVTKKVMEYCYEPEMEERSGYEVYLLEAAYKDPAGCAARNVHGFTQDDIERMAGQWEQAPSLYLRLDSKSLFHGDDLKESGIQEVDMDTEDGGSDGGLSGPEERNPEKVVVPPLGDNALEGSSKDQIGRNAEIDHPIEAKELGRSKWSTDFDEDDVQTTEASKGKLSSLSGLIQAYGKEGKSVHWGDQVGNTGFSIGVAKKSSLLSLVIGPGAGYNLKSNPLSEDADLTTSASGESKGRSVFQEQIRAEHESFRAVFDRRKQRIGGLDVEEE